jgi:putative acetyltransferase
MSKHYLKQDQSRYFIALVNGNIVGGSGIARFHNSSNTCELKKLFLLPEARRLGLGKQLSEACLNFSLEQGYRYCYLDTLKSMTAAISLYRQLGFKHLEKPLEATLHNGCDVWMLKQLIAP